MPFGSTRLRSGVSFKAMRELLLVLVGQSEIAQEEFRKIEKALSSAKTARIKARTTTTFHSRPGYSQIWESEVLLKAGGHVFLSTRDIGSPENSHLIIANPTKLKMRLGTGETAVLEGRPELTYFVPENIVQRGLPCGNGKRARALGMFRQGGDEGGAKTLEYQLQDIGPMRQWASYEVKLWYEANSYRLLKRITKSTLPAFTQTEVYTEYILGEDIPDWKFSFPREY